MQPRPDGGRPSHATTVNYLESEDLRRCCLVGKGRGAGQWAGRGGGAMRPPRGGCCAGRPCSTVLSAVDYRVLPLCRYKTQGCSAQVSGVVHDTGKSQCMPGSPLSHHPRHCSATAAAPGAAARRCATSLRSAAASAAARSRSAPTAATSILCTSWQVASRGTCRWCWGEVRRWSGQMVCGPGSGSKQLPSNPP